MKPPVLVINFKTYRSSFGARAREIARAAERISRDLGVEVAVSPPLVETAAIAREVSIPVLAQHGDPLYYGAHTGHVPLEALRDAGVRGVLVNHSEDPLDLRSIVRISEISRDLGLETLVCADSVGMARLVAEYARPSAVALEPPELIGTGTAVSRARPEVISRGVSAVKSVSKEILVLAGAGISEGVDVEKALDLGAEGVLVASAIMLSKDPGEAIAAMASALLRAWRRG